VILRHGGHEKYDLDMAQFLARIIKGTLVSKAIPSDLIGEHGPRFLVAS
jgi:hypothetical protein